MKKLTNKESNLVAGGCSCVNPSSFSKDELINSCSYYRSGEADAYRGKKIMIGNHISCDCNYFVSQAACQFLSSEDIADIDKKLGK